MSDNLSIIVASDLRTGRSVYLTASAAWNESSSCAQVYSAEAAKSALAHAVVDEQNNRVIDPYLVAVDSARSDHPALLIRERIRQTGPTINSPSVRAASASQVVSEASAAA